MIGERLSVIPSFSHQGGGYHPITILRCSPNLLLGRCFVREPASCKAGGQNPSSILFGMSQERGQCNSTA